MCQLPLQDDPIMAPRATSGQDPFSTDFGWGGPLFHTESHEWRGGMSPSPTRWSGAGALVEPNGTCCRAVATTENDGEARP